MARIRIPPITIRKGVSPIISAPTRLATKSIPLIVLKTKLLNFQYSLRFLYFSQRHFERRKPLHRQMNDRMNPAY